MSDNLFDTIANELGDGHTFVEENDAGTDEIRNVVQPAPYIDPLHAELARLQRAARNSGGLDEFYQLVEAKLDSMKTINAEVARVGNPTSATGQNLGGAAKLTSDLVVVQKSVARWQGLDAENGPVTVTMGPVTPLVVGAGAVVRPFAYIHWGAYGFNWVVEVDIGTGRQFTVNAAMIEVEVALDALSTANAQQANLAANLSFKAMVRTAPLIRTRYIDSLTQNSSQAVTVPPFAVGILPVMMSDSGTPGIVQLDFKDSSGTIRYSILVTNGAQLAPIPLAGDIVSVLVTNTTATTQHIRLPFELSI